ILCSKCSKLFDNNIKLDLTTISLMEYVLRNDILTCSKAKVSKYITHELENILDKYLKVYVDNINFKSLHVLQSVKNNKGVDNDE
ncbi:DNA repair protein RecO C-terminal domain-containing protein, partial [Clostridioides difficile]